MIEDGEDRFLANSKRYLAQRQVSGVDTFYLNAKRYLEQRNNLPSDPSKRKFFGRMAALGGAAAVTAAALPLARSLNFLGVSSEPSAVSAAEVAPPLVTYGKFNGENVEVLRPTGLGNFVVRDATGEAEIPMESLEIDKGDLSWAKEIEQPVPWLGFDCAQGELIDKIPQIGAGIVRIPLEGDVTAAITRAKEKNLKVMLMFNPGKLNYDANEQRRLDKALSTLRGYGKVSFELGNDIDWDVSWEEGDLNKFALFFVKASHYIKTRLPDAEIVVGAPREEGSVRKLVLALRQYMDPHTLTYALHAYNKPEEVQKRVAELKLELGTDVSFIFSELGYNQSEEEKGKTLVKMAEEAKKLGAKEIIMFQLRNIAYDESLGDKGFWGVVSPDGKWEHSSLPIIDYVWGLTQPNP